ncbi:MAG: hypothetical protein IPL79_11460 [Myxococcales bacterium]|nr:hypothetical protein [Myxococcales bacterium]
MTVKSLLRHVLAIAVMGAALSASRAASSAAAAPACVVRFALDEKHGDVDATPSGKRTFAPGLRAKQLLAWAAGLDPAATDTLLNGKQGGPLGAVWNGNNDLVVLCAARARRVRFGAARATYMGTAGAWFVYLVPYAMWREALRTKRVRWGDRTQLRLGVATLRIDGRRLGEFRETGGE